MEIPKILEALEFNTGFFPRGLLKQAVEKREQIVPELLKILEQAASNIHELLDLGGYFAHIYAMYLLSQFRQKEAYPLIVDFFSVPGEISLDLTGDVVTEDLARILASVACGDTSLITKLAENEAVNEYVRGAALKSFLVMFACGEKSRKEVIAYYQSLFAGKLKREFSCVWAELIYCAMRLYPEELYPDIKAAFEEDIVDQGYIGLENVQKQLDIGREKTLGSLTGRHYRLVEDTIKDLGTWACFDSPGKTGRNDSCPCGSGLKYKKCCIT